MADRSNPQMETKQITVEMTIAVNGFGPAR